MIHGLTFKEYVDQEKEKWSEMSKAEKVSYFKEYYLKTCIVAFVVLLLLLWFCVDMAHNMRNLVVSGGVLNLQINDEGRKFLQEDYMASLNLSEKSNKIDFAGDMFLNKEQPDTYTVFQAEMAAATFNYVIADKDGLDYIARIECIADMDEAMDAELKNQVASRIVYKKYGESDTEVACAIDITDTNFAKEYITSAGPVYFVLSGKMDDYQLGLDVLKYILSK